MQKRVEAERFRLFAKEVILKVLQSLDAKSKKLESLGDLDGVKKIDKELILKYEKLFEEVSLELDSHQDYDKLENFKNIIFDIMDKFSLTEAYIEKELEKRKKLGRNSGAEVVKRFFEYQLKELEKKRDSILSIMGTLLEKDEDLNFKLGNAIQEEEEKKYLEELTSTSKQINLLNEKLDILKVKIDELKRSLKTKWRYEIFGNVSREELLKAYKENNSER